MMEKLVIKMSLEDVAAPINSININSARRTDMKEEEEEKYIDN